MKRSTIVRCATVAAKAAVACVALLAVGSPLALGQDAPLYANCPNPADADQVCRFYHPAPDVIATGLCMYGACFEMSYGTAVRVAVADEQGPFPKTWHAWLRGVLTDNGQCIVAESGKKLRVEIAAGSARCRIRVSNDGFDYYEHFVSNPVSGCLGWIECRVPTAP